MLAGKPGYEVTDGEILFNGEDMLEMAPDERAAKGVFLAFQYPVEIPGVATMTFLRTALNAQRKARGEAEYSTPDFLKKVRDAAPSRSTSDRTCCARGVNVGFSGGEKKRNEMLQMAMFAAAPVQCSTRPIPASTSTRCKIACRRRQPRCVRRSARWSSSRTISGCSNYIVPDVVHVMSKGRVVKTGGKELALELEAKGYAQYADEAA